MGFYLSRTSMASYQLTQEMKRHAVIVAIYAKHGHVCMLFGSCQVVCAANSEGVGSPKWVYVTCSEAPKHS